MEDITLESLSKKVLELYDELIEAYRENNRLLERLINKEQNDG
jgi:hypothetical protein